jgi:hypothetical protein
LNSDEEKEWEGHICKICDNEYVSKSVLAQHISLVHEKGKTKSYKCPICDHIFHQISVFKHHVKTVHEGRVCEKMSCELNKNHERARHCPKPLGWRSKKVANWLNLVKIFLVL